MAAPSSATAPRTPGSLARSRPRYGEQVIKALLTLAAVLSIATTVGIVVSLLEPTVKFFGEVSAVEFFASTEWGPLFEPPHYGVLPLVSATLITTGIAILVAVPLGLGAAIYLSEYARPRVRKFFKPILEVLAGVPTVVFGFFALSFVTPLLREIMPFEIEIFNALSAGLVVGFMIIPIVASLSEDAMTAVPNALREGSYALGASKMITSIRVVLPAAFSGIVAAVILAVSRGAGETMIVYIAGGGKPNFTFDIGEGMQTMAAFIAAAGSGDVPIGTVDYNTIFAVGSLLFVMTFVMNFISVRLVRKYREVYE
jgi:phosphate transport system permease protein